MTVHQKAYIALAATSFLWGTSWVASKIGIQHVPGLEVASIRQFLGGSLFVIFFLLKGEPFPKARDFIWLTFMGILLFAAANGLATVALRYIPSGMAALIAALYPLSVVILEKIFFRTTGITWVTIVGLLLGIGGIGLVLYDNAFHGYHEGYTTGIIISLVAMLSWSVGTIFIIRRKTRLNPYYATGWQMLLGSFLLMISTIVSGDNVPLTEIPMQTWLAIAYLVGASSIVAFVAFIYTMKHLEPAIASLYAYINPIVAMIVGSIIVNEVITLYIIIGSLITLFGVYLVNRSFKKQKDLVKQQSDQLTK